LLADFHFQGVVAMSTQQQNRSRLAGLSATALAVLAFASAPVFADEPSIEGTGSAATTMPTPVPEYTVVISGVRDASAGPLTREQVREELREAKAHGTMAGTGEAGDTPEILAARDKFNAIQYDRLMSQAIEEQNAAAAYAELDQRMRDEQAESDLLAVMNIPLSPEDTSSGDVHIDFIAMEAP
jgi:hypothetical protein